MRHKIDIYWGIASQIFYTEEEGATVVKAVDVTIEVVMGLVFTLPVVVTRVVALARVEDIIGIEVAVTVDVRRIEVEVALCIPETVEVELPRKVVVELEMEVLVGLTEVEGIGVAAMVLVAPPMGATHRTYQSYQDQADTEIRSSMRTSPG